MSMKEINGFPRYKITDTGKVLSYVGGKNGFELKPQLASQSRKKYLQVRLFSDEYKHGQLHYLHRLVWNTFVGDIPEHLEINHIDENPRNCSLDNLELLTRGENIREYHRNNSTFLRNNRDNIISDYKELKSYQKVADKWGCGISSINRIIKNTMYIKINGKRTLITADDTINDFFSQGDLRSTEIKETLGIKPSFHYTQKYKSTH